MAVPGNDHSSPRQDDRTVLPLRDTFVALFLFPQAVLICARRWPQPGRAALLAGSVLLACCLILGLGRAPRTLAHIGDVAAWLGREMGELRRTEDGGIAWERPENAPEHIEFRGVRVDFAETDREFDLQHVAEEHFSGLWITPREIRFWTGGAKGLAWTAFAADSPRDNLNWNERFPPGSTLAGERFAPSIRRGLRWAVPLFMFLSYLVVVLGIYLAFMAMFTLVPLLLRRPRAPGEARAALCVNLYCSVVPLIVATAYHLALPLTLDFPTLFVFAFLGYLIWAYSRVRRFLTGGGPRNG